MCMFSRPVLRVARTKIFARRSAADRQMLAYSMEYAAREALAMILPLPVPPNSPDDAVRFVDLSGYGAFFADLEDSFRSGIAVHSGSSRAPAPAAYLSVHAVGRFDASFVPTRHEFVRLDPRFRLPESVLETLPEYADAGFVVVQLRPDPASSLLAPPHPIAFEFATCQPEHLFFPTLHVHDGTVPDHADFSHTLYAQHPSRATSLSWNPWPENAHRASRLRWERARRELKEIDRAQGILSREPLFRAKVQGSWPNVDLWARLA